MDLNPYQPPAPPSPSPAPNPFGAAAPNRIYFVLATVGAGLASVYWAMMTLLLGVGVAAGSLSVASVVVPVFLIVFYALRGFQIFKGDVNAARRILWLHAIGGIFALMRMAGAGALLIALNGFKVAIHIFGGVTAYLAYRSAVGRPR